MKKTLLFAAVTVIAFLALSDLGLRLFISPPPPRPFEWPPPDMTRHGMTTDKALFWKLRPGYNGPWQIYKLAYTHELIRKTPIDWEARKQATAPAYKEVTWKINQDGFRGRLVSTEKSPKTMRLLFMGSSITFGWGVRADEAFPEVTRKRLERACPGISFEAINAGVPGYSSYQGLQYLKTLLPAYKPDMVIAEFGINDGTMAVGKADKAWQPRFSNKILVKLRNIGWGRLTLRVFDPLIKKPAVMDTRQTYEEAKKNFYRISMTGTKTRVAPNDFRANLREMEALCQENDSLFFVYIPSLYNEFGEKRLISSVDFTLLNAIPIHQTLSAYPEKGLKDLFLPFDEGHLSPTGHKVVGECMAGFFGQQPLKI